MTPDTKPEQESPVFFGKGMIAVIVGIVIILVALLVAGMMQAGQGTVVPPAACGEKAIAYINNNLVQQGTTAQLISINESHGVYRLTGQYQSQTITLYMTKDCTLLFTNPIDMTASTGGQQSTQATQAPVKSARPAVDLYVMSFCPYGTQAETVMSPVVDLLKSKADIRIRYITTITGSTVDSVDSLHGMPEAQEDLRQICINKYYPEKYWAYINAFNDACYPSWNNATALSSCRKDTAAALSIDNAKINSCAEGAEGLAVLKVDETASAKDGASASPTLVINGVQYSGARTPEAYKQAICNSFETAPAECSTQLSSTSSAATGGC
jgi:protein-disulfide isomerase